MVKTRKRKFKSNMIDIRLQDNMEMMSKIKDKTFDLAIVDPPYGISVHKMNYTKSTKGGVTKRNDYSSIGDWDSNTPDKKYFEELFRVSKNQLIFGGNYFELPLTKSWLIWDKKTEDKYSNDFADCELCWTSFNKPAKIFRWLWSGMMQQNMKNKESRFHPTQKPVSLYEWILDNYAKEGDKILDTHLGSGSIAIACHNRGYEFLGCEISEEYFIKAEERIERHKKQLKLF